MPSVNSASYSSLINSLTNNTASTQNSELTTESFFKLIAAQLENQDMSNPMDNSEMMTQMTQIAMMQAMNNFSTAMDDFSQINTINYGTSMMGKDVLIYSTDGKGNTKKLNGTVTRVDIYSGVPTIYIDDDETGYSLANVMSVYEEGHEPPSDLGDDPKKTDTDPNTDTGDKGDV